MLEIKVELSPASKAMLKIMPKQFKDGIYKGMKRAVLTTEADAKKDFSQHLNIRTGTLRRGIKSKVVGLVGEVYDDVVYAGIQQYGGTIKAKAGGKLRFPTDTGWATASEVVIPARPFINPDEDKITRILEEEITKEVNK